MFAVLKSGGIIMIPIILCAIAATFIIIERCIYFSSIKKRDEKLKAELSHILEKRDFAAAEISCVTAGTPLAQVIRKAFSVRKLQEADAKELVQAEMDAVVPQFEHLLTLLGTIANISTLLGLLGTVTGNIKAFGILGQGGSMGNPQILAGAIAEALVTTAAGLFVSIPAVVFHNFFVSRVNHCVSAMEAEVTHVMIRLSGRVL
jgi:biopolymer transport protein ExbB